MFLHFCPRHLAIALAMALVVSFGGALALAEQPALPAFVIIVNAKNPARDLDRDFVSDVFLKKTTRWGDGDTIRPVDLAANSAARASFSEKVLRRSVAAVRSYWQQRIFSGRDLPPPELASDEAVLAYVRGNRDAIGYVSGTTQLGDLRAVAIH